MTGKFEVYQDKTGRFRFRLRSRNGQVLAVSAEYSSKLEALAGIQSLKEAAEHASIATGKDHPVHSF